MLSSFEWHLFGQQHYILPSKGNHQKWENQRPKQRHQSTAIPTCIQSMYIYVVKPDGIIYNAKEYSTNNNALPPYWNIFE